MTQRIILNLLKVITSIMFICFLLFFSNNKVYINYDSIPYAASSYLLKNNDKDLAHRYAWNLLETKVSPEIFQNLCCSTEYRLSMAENKTAFFSHLPAYTTKSGYIFLIRLVSDTMKVDEYVAMKLITNISVVLVTLLACMYFINKSLFIYLSIFPILLISQILGLGRLLTPDALIALILLGSSCLLVSNRFFFGYALMLFSILLRPINIIFFSMACLIFLQRVEFKKFFIMISLGIILYFLNSWYFGSLGYWKHFYSNLIYLPSTFIDFNPTFSFNLYLNVLRDKFFWMIASPELNRFVGIILLNSMLSSFAIYKRMQDKHNEIFVAALLSYGTVCSFILFPVPDHRLYSGLVIASSLMLLSGFTRKLN